MTIITPVTFGSVYRYDPKQFNKTTIKKHSPHDLVFKKRRRPTPLDKFLSEKTNSFEYYVATGEDAAFLRGELDIYKMLKRHVIEAKKNAKQLNAVLQPIDRTGERRRKIQHALRSHLNNLQDRTIVYQGLYKTYCEKTLKSCFLSEPYTKYVSDNENKHLNS